MARPTLDEIYGGQTKPSLDEIYSQTPPSLDEIYGQNAPPEPQAAAQTEPSSFSRRAIADPLLGLARGAAKLPNVVVGLADIATGGKTGKFIEDTTGYDFGAADKFYNPLLSPETQAAQQEVSRAFKDDGFVSGLGSAISNPSVIAQTVTESLPAMLLGGGAARLGLKAAGAAASRFAPLAVGAGEGAVTSGQIAEDIRLQNPDRELTGKQAGLSMLAGLGTAGIGAAGSKLANSAIGQRLGLADIDSVLAGVARETAGDTTPGAFKRAAAGLIQEGLLEELPQSMQEQVLQNIAQDKPWDDGLAEAAGLGLLSGGVMGAGSSAAFGGAPTVGLPAAASPAPTPVPDVSPGVLPPVETVTPPAAEAPLPPTQQGEITPEQPQAQPEEEDIFSDEYMKRARAKEPIVPPVPQPEIDVNGEVGEESPLTQWIKTLPYAKQRIAVRRMGEDGGMAVVLKQFLDANPEYTEPPQQGQAPVAETPEGLTLQKGDLTNAEETSITEGRENATQGNAYADEGREKDGLLTETGPVPGSDVGGRMAESVPPPAPKTAPESKTVEPLNLVSGENVKQEGVPEAEKPQIQPLDPEFAGALRVQKVGDDGIKLETKDGSHVMLRLRNAGLSGMKDDPKMGEIFFQESKTKRQGIGTKLSQEALRRIVNDGGDKVKVMGTSPEGRAHIQSLIDKGYIGPAIDTSETGSSSHLILSVDGKTKLYPTPLPPARQRQTDRAAKPAARKPRLRNLFTDIKAHGGIKQSSLERALDKNEIRGSKNGNRYLSITGNGSTAMGVDQMAQAMADQGWQVPRDLNGEVDADAFAQMLGRHRNVAAEIHPDDVETLAAKEELARIKEMEEQLAEESLDDLGTELEAENDIIEENEGDAGDLPERGSDSAVGTSDSQEEGFRLDGGKSGKRAGVKEKQDALFATPPTFGKKPQKGTAGNLDGMIPDEVGLDLPFSRATAPKTTAQTPDQFRAAAESTLGKPLTKSLFRVKNRDGKPLVTVAASMQEIPAETIPIKGRDGTEKAFYHPAEDRMYFVSDRIDPHEVLGLLMHENIHARGKTAVGSEQFARLLDRVDAMREAGSKPVVEAFDRVPKDTKPENVREEVLAYLIEKYPQHGLVRRFFAQVKAWLHDKGFINTSRLNDADLGAIALNALKSTARGEVSGPLSGEGNPDIRFSKTFTDKSAPEVMTSIKETLMFSPGIGHFMQMFSREGKTLNPLNKSVNTMYHLAETHPKFKAVYLAGQKFMSDVAAFTYKAEALAPSWFPKPKFTLGKNILKDALPSLSKEDNALISRALADGTLANGANPTTGVKWTDDQLRTDYGMTPAQIATYHEAHAVIAQSLDDVTRSNMFVIQRKLKLDLADITDPRLVPVNEYAKSLTAKLEESIEGAKNAIEAAEDEKETKRLAEKIATFEAAAKSITKLAKENAALKKAGYYSLSRFGEFTVTVTETLEDGKTRTELFTMHESQMAARKAERDLKAAYADQPQFSVEWGKMSKEDYKLFGGLNLDSLSLFAEYADPDQGALYQKYLDKVVNNRSALKKLMHRKGTAGFTSDGARSIANFLYTNARLAAKNFNLGEMKDAASKIDDNKELRDIAINLHDYLVNPVEEFSRIRGVLFSWYLGGSLASGFTNLTQTAMMTGPYLSALKFDGKEGGAKAAHKHIMAAVVKALTPNAKMNQSDTLTKWLIKADEEGHTAPQDIHQMAAIAGNRLGASNPKWNLTLKAWGSIFALTETYNRRIAFIAAFNLATENGQTETQAYKTAVEAVNATQGVYNKANRPVFARGAGAVIMTFKQYSIMYMELFSRLPKKQKLMMLGLLMLGGGAEGLPFADDLMDLIDTLGQWMGHATNTKRTFRQKAKEQLGEEMGAFLSRGLSAFAPIDFQARLGLGNLIPGTALLKQSSTDKTRDIKEMVGPAAGLLVQAGDALELMAKGQIAQAMKSAAPKAVQAVATGTEMLATGQATDKYGRKTFDTTPGEAAIKLVGFNPTRMAEESQAKSGIMQDRQLLSVRKEEILAQWANGILTDDRAEKQAAAKKLDQWNKDNPDLPIRITTQMRMNRVKTLRQSAQQRFLKSTPKDMRKSVASELN